jgi:hypothetical protein
MKVGDLIYCHHDDEYGILVELGLDGWIVVAQGDTEWQYQKCWWRKIS